MNKKEQLLADSLANGEQFALAAAARVRRGRAFRRTGFAAGVVATLAAVLFVTHQPASAPSPVRVAPQPAFEIMSDEELLAALKDQPVLVLKDDHGITGVIFLDEKAARKL